MRVYDCTCITSYKQLPWRSGLPASSHHLIAFKAASSAAAVSGEKLDRLVNDTAKACAETEQAQTVVEKAISEAGGGQAGLQTWTKQESDACKTEG